MNTQVKLKLLLVEDSEDDMVLLLDVLSAGGLAVDAHRVEDRAGLVAAMEQGGWQAVICDHNLPALDSATALTLVQSYDSRVPFIIVSGLISDEQASAAMLAGAADFVRKDNYSRLVPALKRELRDIAMHDALQASHESLHWTAYYDGITGLPNRAHLLNHLHGLIAEESGGSALFMLDLNRFRQINASLGSLAGNEVLTTVARRLNEIAGSTGFVASLGVDRFALVVPGLLDEGSARRLAQGIREALAEPIRIGGQEIYLGASIGVCLDGLAGSEVETFFHCAELALRAAKAEGRNTVSFYHPGLSSEDTERLALESALHRALQESEFRLHYQPQVDLATGEVIGAEALIRWQHPERGLVPPMDFIPMLEETGLIVPVGEWAMRTACAQIRDWHAAGFTNMRCAVNLSVIQFRQPDLAQSVRSALDEAGIPAWALELEITENIALYNEEATIATLKQLDAMGVSLAIDDFGTGYSSLSYLQRFPVDKLKIDRSFIKDIGCSRDGGAIARAVIAMAHSLGLKVVAEGIETAEQAEFLVEHGCEEAQGFYYSRPVTAEVLTEQLAAARSGA